MAGINPQGADENDKAEKDQDQQHLETSGEIAAAAEPSNDDARPDSAAQDAGPLEAPDAPETESVEPAVEETAPTENTQSAAPPVDADEEDETPEKKAGASQEQAAEEADPEEQERRKKEIPEYMPGIPGMNVYPVDLPEDEEEKDTAETQAGIAPADEAAAQPVKSGWMRRIFTMAASMSVGVAAGIGFKAGLAALAVTAPPIAIALGAAVASSLAVTALHRWKDMRSYNKAHAEDKAGFFEVSKTGHKGRYKNQFCLGLVFGSIGAGLGVFAGEEVKELIGSAWNNITGAESEIISSVQPPVAESLQVPQTGIESTTPVAPELPVTADPAPQGGVPATPETTLPPVLADGATGTETVPAPQDVTQLAPPAENIAPPPVADSTLPPAEAIEAPKTESLPPAEPVDTVTPPQTGTVPPVLAESVPPAEAVEVLPPQVTETIPPVAETVSVTETPVSTLDQALALLPENADATLAETLQRLESANAAVHDQAVKDLGNFFANGFHGIAENDALANQLFETVLHNKQAAHDLGYQLLHGFGAEADYGRAYELLTQAQSEGHKLAAEKLQYMQAMNLIPKAA